MGRKKKQDLRQKEKWNQWLIEIKLKIQGLTDRDKETEEKRTLKMM